MRPVHSSAVRLRKAIIEIITRHFSEWLHGNARPISEIWDEIETLIADAIHEAVQDAISEIRRDDE